MTPERLTELGFENLPKATIDETSDAIHAQIDNDPDLADEVLEAVKSENDPFPVDKDNYDLFLDNWVETQAEALHLTQY